MVLLANRHGLRAIELVDLRWDQIDFEHATLTVRRAKKDELRALRRLAREQDPKSPFVFTSERGPPFPTAGFARMVERARCGWLRIQGASAHVEARLRFRPGQQGPRYAIMPIWGTRTSSTPCATPSWRRIALIADRAARR